ADFLLTNVNPNSAVWWKRYAWTVCAPGQTSGCDLNGDRRFQLGEEGRVIQTSGGPTESLDPDIQDTYTNEAAVWFERELMANFGVRTGFLWRGQRQRYQRVNVNQPFEAFNVPVTIPDP